jgi:hypothetical protein
MLWGGPRRSKTSQSLFRVGTRWCGRRLLTPLHSMVVVGDRLFTRNVVQASALPVSEFVTGGTEQQHQGGVGLGLVGGP